MLVSLLVPYLPPAENKLPTQPAIIQAASNANKIDMELTGYCTNVQTPDNPVGRLPGVSGSFAPAWAIRDYYENTRMSNAIVDVTRAKTTIIDGPKHGNVVTLSGTDPTMGPYYQYNPNPGYRGADNVIALVEFDGKRVKVHLKFFVVQQVGDEYPPDNIEANDCVHGKTIKRIVPPVRGDAIPLFQWIDIVQNIAMPSGSFEFSQGKTETDHD